VSTRISRETPSRTSFLVEKVGPLGSSENQVPSQGRPLDLDHCDITPPFPPIIKEPVISSIVNNALAAACSFLAFISVHKSLRPSFYRPKYRVVGPRRWKVQNDRTGLPTFEGTFCGRKATFLIDSGATNNFVNLNFVRKHHIEIAKGEAKQVVRLADGSERSSSFFIAGAHLKMGTHREYGNFITLPLNGHQFDVILGMPWLTKRNPDIDWSAHRITFRQEQSSVSMNSTSSSSQGTCSLIKTKALKKAMRCNQLEQIFLVALQEVKEEKPEKPPDGCEREEEEKILQEYNDLFPAELPKHLPIARTVDHRIDIIPGSAPAFKQVYRASPVENDAIKKHLDELLEKGLVQPSKSPYGAPVLMVKKPDGTFRFCVDYRALNAITIKNSYPLPRVDELFDRLEGARHFSSLDLLTGYWQIRVANEDVEKTAFRTRYGHYEWRVLPMGLMNAPATFMRLMNDIFRKYLDDFVIVFLDDILIYSKTLEDHRKHVRIVLDLLRENKLWAKKSKCHFFQDHIQFLGHQIDRHGMHMMEKKVDGILKWPSPKSLDDVRSYLGTVGYYRKFMQHFSQTAGPLTELLKKESGFHWNTQQEKAFQALKDAVTTAPTLILPDPKLPYVLTADASGYGIGASLMQDHGKGLQPIAFMSKKLTPAELKYPNHERELLALYRALKEWRHYLYGSEFTLRSDHKNLIWICSQKQLSSRQAHWIQFFQEFAGLLPIEYYAGKLNQVADGLSRRPDHRPASLPPPVPVLDNLMKPSELNLLGTTLIESGTFLDDIRAAIRADPHTMEILRHIKRDPRITLKDDLLRWKTNRLYIPDDSKLRAVIYNECHDSPISGHVGTAKTTAAITKLFYWPHMQDEIKKYVSTCAECQRNKPLHLAPAGLLQPLPIPDKPWTDIGMDLITQLPRSKSGYDCIITFVDRFTKQIHCVPCNTTITAPKLVSIFLREVVRHHGMPKTIVSDRDPRFTGQFWRTLFEMFKTKLAMSTSFHPQTDGQTEKANRTIEDIIRTYVNTVQDDWDEYLTFAEIAYNKSIQASTGFEPYYLNTGREFPTLLTYALEDAGIAKNPAAADRIVMWNEAIAKARESIKRAQERQARYANEGRRNVTFKVGDMVALSTENLKNAILGGTMKLSRKWMGPYPITKAISRTAYELELPPNMKIHPVFHIHLLREWRDPKAAFPERVRYPTPQPVFVDDGEPEWHVEDIIQKRMRGRKVQYRVIWKGYPPEEATWEDEDIVKDLEALDRFEERIKMFPPQLRARVTGTNRP
jgi:predicted aspartyl protease